MRTCIIILLMITLTGCGGITLTARENDIISEYAAGVLLKYDKNYGNRLVRIVEIESVVAEENETSLTAENVSGINVTVTEDVVSVEDETTANIEMSLNDALKIGQLIGNYEGYFITDSYPKDEVGFSMKAVDGFKLLILEFSLENPTGETITEDIILKKLSFNIMVNKEIKANSQLTMLLDDLSSFKDEVDPHSIKDLVLIFQVPDRYENDDSISSMTLNIKDANTSLPISLK